MHIFPRRQEGLSLLYFHPFKLIYFTNKIYYRGNLYLSELKKKKENSSFGHLLMNL